jgi:regulator of replication initiation timing
MISPESELLARLEKMEQALAALAIQNETLRSENARLEAENKLLRARIDKLVRRIFGRSSEPRPLAGAETACRQAARRAKAAGGAA